MGTAYVDIASCRYGLFDTCLAILQKNGQLEFVKIQLEISDDVNNGIPTSEINLARSN